MSEGTGHTALERTLHGDSPADHAQQTIAKAQKLRGLPEPPTQGGGGDGGGGGGGGDSGSKI